MCYGLVWIREAPAGLEAVQAGYTSVDKSLEILLGRCLRAGWWSVGTGQGEIAYVGRAPESEDIVGRFWELVELWAT